MDQHVSNIIHYMAMSHVEMAQIIEQKRHVAVHMSQLVQQISDHPSFNTVEEINKNSIMVIESVTSYLNSIADLEEAIAENLTHVMKEMCAPLPAEEE